MRADQRDPAAISRVRAPVRQLIDRWRKRRKAQKKTFSNEDSELVSLVCMRALCQNGLDKDDKRAREGWITHSYAKKLRKLRRRARQWQLAASAAALIVAALGALAAVAGALGKGIGQHSAWSIVAITTGSAVAAITGLTRARQPEVEHERVARTRAQLRQEGWAYVQPLGDYKKVTQNGDSYVKFAERVSAISAAYENQADASRRGIGRKGR